jgi:hypothetical protein
LVLQLLDEAVHELPLKHSPVGRNGNVGASTRLLAAGGIHAKDPVLDLVLKGLALKLEPCIREERCNCERIMQVG